MRKANHYAPTILHTPKPDPQRQAEHPRLRGVFENEGPMGPLENVPYLWARQLLRFFKEQARHEAFSRDTHPIIRSIEPGEDWRWCYVDKLLID